MSKQNETGKLLAQLTIQADFIQDILCLLHETKRGAFEFPPGIDHDAFAENLLSIAETSAGDHINTLAELQNALGFDALEFKGVRVKARVTHDGREGSEDE